MLKPLDTCDAIADAGLVGLAAFYSYSGCPGGACVSELVSATNIAVGTLALARMSQPKVTPDERKKIFTSSIIRYVNLGILLNIVTDGELGGLTGSALSVGILGLKWYFMNGSLQDPMSYMPQIVLNAVINPFERATLSRLGS